MLIITGSVPSQPYRAEVHEWSGLTSLDLRGLRVNRAGCRT
jgi:hypothetical protein